MNATENPNSGPTDPLPKEILGRLENLYPKLAPVTPGTAAEVSLAAFGSPALEMPSLDTLSTRVSQCSFKFFDNPAAYFQSPRAKEFVTWSTPRSDAYRVYFNAYSRKVYIDLNAKRWQEVHSKREEEILYCDILRTLIWVLTCEVEAFEARAAEANSENVTSEVTEVIIP